MQWRGNSDDFPVRRNMQKTPAGLNGALDKVQRFKVPGLLETTEKRAYNQLENSPPRLGICHVQ